MSERVDMRANGGTLAAAVSLLIALVLVIVPTARAENPTSSKRIVGGESTTIEEWPWQVALARPPAEGGDGYERQFCGGTLVSPTSVVTAAHCVYDGGFVAPGAQTVITGRTTLSSEQGAEIAVSDVIYFVQVEGKPAPQSSQQPAAGSQLYVEDTSEWDVAVLELASAAPAPAKPVDIASPSERNIWETGDPAFATGWGATINGNPFTPDDLREVEVEVISDMDCGDLPSYGSSFVPSVMVCAGVPTTGGKDTCQGDSGGPLVAPADGGGFRLFGVTSFGVGCAAPEKYGVYARVAGTTMRAAVAASINAADGEPAPAPNTDGTSPKTTFTKKPAKSTRKRTARFRWEATRPSTFTCSLDGAKPKSCASPFSKRVKVGRRHTLEVTATDALGAVEKSPASYSWKVKRRGRR